MERESVSRSSVSSSALAQDQLSEEEHLDHGFHLGRFDPGVHIYISVCIFIYFQLSVLPHRGQKAPNRSDRLRLIHDGIVPRMLDHRVLRRAVATVLLRYAARRSEQFCRLAVRDHLVVARGQDQRG